ncbi:MAG: PIN domain-containing protein [Candidatus Acidiferrales bacterium]
MTSKLRAIYWDSTVFLCFLKKHEVERRSICEDILRHARDGKLSLYTSSFTITEVIKPLRRESTGPRPLSSDEVADIQGMFQWPWLKKIDLDQRVAQNAVNLGITYALTPADAIHAASAIVAKVDVLQQWERSAGFEKISRLVPVETPRMITYGVVQRVPARGNYFEQLHRARAATAR